MPRIERKELLENFRGMIAPKEPIVETALTQQVRAFKKITF